MIGPLLVSEADGALISRVGAVVSTVMLVDAVASLPSESVAMTVIALDPSTKLVRL